MDQKTVAIRIGEDVSDFFVRDLQQLTYFKAKFSDRWKSSSQSSNKNEKSDAIVIFESQKDAIVPFTTDQLALLLQIDVNVMKKRLKD